MTDESPSENGERAKDPTRNDGRRPDGGRPVDPRYFQRNLANRLFPGPSELMSRKAAERIEGLLNPADGDAQTKPWRDRRQSAPATAATPTATATPEDLAKVQESLEQQNELLRAILASSVDTQADARSTAQNSRTFAWAGTAIALLTLIATVISIVAAVQAG